MKPIIQYSPEPIISPEPGCSWAETMVLNPAMIKDPESDSIHMLFRATGPYSHKKAYEYCRDPYPIFLGYARSDDLGRTWNADFTTPALSPSLEYNSDALYIMDDAGKLVFNYVNGCVEDPRIFELEGQLYVTVAGRLFPPGPYWNLNPEGTINTPEWALTQEAAKWIDNTTSVIYQLNLNELKCHNYEAAFTYICNLTDPTVTDNRDVFFFPEKMKIHGKLQYVMLHRPHNPEKFEEGKGHHRPSIMLAASEHIKDFTTAKATHKFLAEGIFAWEEERIGASWPPIKISESEWLLQYHGKALPGYGYTQSFMILKEADDDFPQIVHRCPERLMYARQDWELPDKFMCPCLFTTGGIVMGNTLIMSYGAADQKAGIAWTDFKMLIAYVRTFDASGNEMKL